MTKLKREEAEKQKQAAMRIAKQKLKIAMRKKELEIQMEQMALQELEEDHHPRVAAAEFDEAELMDNRSLFSHHTSELNLLKDRGSGRSQRLVQEQVNSFPPGNSMTAGSELIFLLKYRSNYCLKLSENYKETLTYQIRKTKAN